MRARPAGAPPAPWPASASSRSAEGSREPGLHRPLLAQLAPDPQAHGRRADAGLEEDLGRPLLEGLEEEVRGRVVGELERQLVLGLLHVDVRLDLGDGPVAGCARAAEGLERAPQRLGARQDRVDGPLDEGLQVRDEGVVEGVPQGHDEGPLVAADGDGAVNVEGARRERAAAGRVDVAAVGEQPLEPHLGPRRCGSRRRAAPGTSSPSGPGAPALDAPALEGALDLLGERQLLEGGRAVGEGLAGHVQVHGEPQVAAQRAPLDELLHGRTGAAARGGVSGSSAPAATRRATVSAGPTSRSRARAR